MALAIDKKGRAHLMTNPQRLGTDLGEKKVLADINEYGWHAMHVVEDDGHPPWTFTIGLYVTVPGEPARPCDEPCFSRPVTWLLRVRLRALRTTCLSLCVCNRHQSPTKTLLVRRHRVAQRRPP
jgi:hypothetical protein